MGTDNICLLYRLLSLKIKLLFSLSLICDVCCLLQLYFCDLEVPQWSKKLKTTTSIYQLFSLSMRDLLSLSDEHFQSSPLSNVFNFFLVATSFECLLMLMAGLPWPLVPFGTILYVPLVCFPWIPFLFFCFARCFIDCGSSRQLIHLPLLSKYLFSFKNIYRFVRVEYLNWVTHTEKCKRIFIYTEQQIAAAKDLRKDHNYNLALSETHILSHQQLYQPMSLYIPWIMYVMC